ncbi:hypothetical protein ACTQ49_08855 [Luteococcus sp. Sow4_B9]|uniref:hypothetical protein n=1 Tax=Luteococcus sp. Sow4_B9 TaxID=3438792 RepID=UPI003F987958
MNQTDKQTAGTWAVVVGALAVLVTTIASGVLFKGYLVLARMPGPMPSLDALPDNPEARAGSLWMMVGAGCFAVAAILALVAIGAGFHFSRRPDGYSRGVWALALGACTPVLAIMLLSGMGAT